MRRIGKIDTKKKKLYVVLEERIDWETTIKEELSNRADVSTICTNNLDSIKELVKQLKERDDFDVSFVRFDPASIKELDLEDIETALEMGVETRPVNKSETK